MLSRGNEERALSKRQIESATVEPQKVQQSAVSDLPVRETEHGTVACREKGTSHPNYPGCDRVSDGKQWMRMKAILLKWQSEAGDIETRSEMGS